MTIEHYVPKEVSKFLEKMADAGIKKIPFRSLDAGATASYCGALFYKSNDGQLISHSTHLPAYGFDESMTVEVPA